MCKAGQGGRSRCHLCQGGRGCAILVNPRGSCTSCQEILDDGEGKYSLSVWALEDYDAQEWVLKGTVNTHEVFGEDSCIDGNSEPEFEVVDMHQDCNVVFFTHPLQRSTLVAYDMDSKEVSVIATLDDGTNLRGTARYVPCRFS